MELYAEAGPVRHSRHVLRHGQPRRGLRRQHDRPLSGGHDGGRPRRQDRQGEVEGRQRRSEEGRDGHERARHRQGQGAGRHLRRRVRRPRPFDRLQPQGRQAALARLLGRPRRRAARRPGEDHVARQADRQGLLRSRPGPATSGRSAAARPGAGSRGIPSSTSSTTAPPIPRPGTRCSAPAPTASPSIRSGP